MAKLEVIDGKQTNWCGLWWDHSTNSFRSGALNLSELRKFKGKVKLVIRKNKFYNNSENNRPNYNFILRDAKSEKDSVLTVEDIDDYVKAPYCENGQYFGEDGNRLYTVDEVRKIINGTFDDAYYHHISDPYDIMPEDFVC